MPVQGFVEGEEVALDIEDVTARLPDQLAYIPETDGEELQQTDGIGPLPRIVLLVSAPFNQSCPAGEGRQLKRQVVLPEFVSNAEHRQTLQHNIFRLIR